MFSTKGFEVRKGLLSNEMLSFLDQYLYMRSTVAHTLKYKYGIEDGFFGVCDTDGQVSNAWSCYSDPGIEVILDRLLPVISEVVGAELVPTYSYTRVYQRDSILEAHTDRPSCKLSCTLNIGGDPWPIFIKDLSGGTHECTLYPGEGLIYRGDILEHWREAFQGRTCSQVFLHYNDKNSTDYSMYDGRDALGMPPV